MPEKNISRKNADSYGKYVEIYIENGKKAIFTPLTKQNIGTFKAIADKKNVKESVFCG